MIPEPYMIHLEHIREIKKWLKSLSESSLPKITINPTYYIPRTFGIIRPQDFSLLKNLKEFVKLKASFGMINYIPRRNKPIN
jgi:hypothetical protein